MGTIAFKATVPSTVVANRVWDVIKEVDPNFSDLHHEMATSGGDTQAYTIRRATVWQKSPALLRSAERLHGDREANSIEIQTRFKSARNWT